MTAFLGIDLGTSGPKVGLLDGSGRVVAWRAAPVALTTGPDGSAEQDPHEWWDAVGEAARAVCAEAPELARRVRAIGVTAQWSGTVALGAEDAVLHPAITWLDTRGADHVRRLTKGRITIARYSPRKAWRWLRQSGGAPTHAGKDPVGHIGWFREAHPDRYARTEVFLEPKDWLNLKLTGRRAASHDSIAMHWVTDIRQLDRVTYSPELLALSGLDPDRLPPLVAPESVLGPTTKSAGEHLGLSGGIPVVAGTPDVHCSGIGAGAVEDGEPHLHLGSSSWLSCHVSFKKTSVRDNMATLPSARAGRYLVANGQECAGICVERALHWLGLTDDDAGYAEFERLADRAAPGAGGLHFLPWLFGERTPVEDPALRGGFINLSLTSSREDLARAVFEGVALNTRWLLERVEAFSNRRLDRIRLVGGAARTGFWSRCMADVLQRRIEVVERPGLANVRGAAYLAGVTTGHWAWSDLRSLTPIARTVTPDPRTAELHADRYRQFRRLHKANRGLFAAMNRPG